MATLPLKSSRNEHTHTHTVLLLFWNLSRTTRVSRFQKGKTRKVKTNLDLLEQEIVSGSGISSQTTTPTSHDSVSCNEQRSVIRFLWAKGLKQMRFTLRILRCFQCMATSVLRDQQYRYGVQRLLAAEKALLIIKKERPGWHVVATTDATIATIDAFIRQM